MNATESMNASRPESHPDVAATVAYFDAEAAGWSARYEGSRHFRTRLETVLGWLSERNTGYGGGDLQPSVRCDGDGRDGKSAGGDERDAVHSDGLNLLDYGCGSGVLMRELLLRGHRVTGVDISERMLATAREHLAPLDRPFRLELASPDSGNASASAVASARAPARTPPPRRAEWRQDVNASSVMAISAQTPPPRSEDWRSQGYDGIFCLGVIEYAEAPEALLGTLADMLQPGGFLVLSWPNAGSLLRRAERLVFGHPKPFAALGLFPHLTAEDSYLHFQRHRFFRDALNRLLAPHGLAPGRVRHHVAPRIMGLLQAHPAIGMSVISEFTKSGPR